MDLVTDLRALLGPDRVKSHLLERQVYAKDAGLVKGPVDVVVLPETTSEVVEVVRIARRHGLPVIPRGAGTGLAGGAVPIDAGVVVALTRLNQIEHVDYDSAMAWVGPGVINQDLSTTTRPHGYHYAPDPSSQSVCTIGGNVATNAGGLHCVAEGTTLAHVLGVELVTAEGDVLMLGGEAPDQPGLDLRAVVVGSEGTLGIVTRVLVRLIQNPPTARTLLLSFGTIADAAGAVSATIAAGIIPSALEMMDQVCVNAVERFVHAGFPLDCAAVLLVEVTGLEEAVDAEAATIADLASRHGATDVRVTADPTEAGLWWKGRKSAFGAVAQMAPDYYLHDTVVPRSKLVEVVTATYDIAEKYGITMMNVFHAGDGNLHPLMAFDAEEPGMLDKVHAAGAEIIEASIAAGGSLSGEHGIGLEKRDYMGLVFSEVDLDAQARLQEAFDPDAVFNPDKVLPVGSRCIDITLSA